MEDRTFKIIVVVCLVIMVSIVGVTASLILNDGLKAPANIPPPNTTTGTDNITTTNHQPVTTPSSKNVAVTATEAKSIATNVIMQPGCVAENPTLHGDTWYVPVYDKNVHKVTGYIFVDAWTGKVTGGTA